MLLEKAILRGIGLLSRMPPARVVQQQGLKARREALFEPAPRTGLSGLVSVWEAKMPVKKISSDEVEIGMVVSSLDRPWSETTFLFQGFQVRNQSDIDQLKAQSRHVHIMVPDEEIEISSGPSSATPISVTTEEIGKERYRDEVFAEAELNNARQSHREMAGLVREIETIVREDKELRLDRVRKSVDTLVDSVTRNPDAYVWLTRIQKFDSYAYRHALSASVWATALGRELGLPRKALGALATGTLLMDIGNTALPRALLRKQGRLSHDEWTLVKSHVEHGVRILSAAPSTTVDVIDIARTHHERLDGSGYPGGLKGKQIPLLGQIAGIVDFYAAVTIPRPYAPAIPPSAAMQMLHRQRQRYFDEALVQAFIQALSTYPTGALVELSTGAVGIVLSQNPGFRLRPNVILLLDPDKRPYGSYPIVNLVNEAQDSRGMPQHVRKTLVDGAYGLNVESLSL